MKLSIYYAFKVKVNWKDVVVMVTIILFVLSKEIRYVGYFCLRTIKLAQVLIMEDCVTGIRFSKTNRTQLWMDKFFLWRLNLAEYVWMSQSRQNPTKASNSIIDDAEKYYYRLPSIKYYHR